MKFQKVGRARIMASVSCLALVGLITVWEGPALAAPDATTTSTEAPAAVQEIVVTAQKRTQSISSVGMAITADTGAQLKTLGVNDVNGLVKVDTSFALAQGNWGGVVYQIRGVGYNDFSLAASPTVSVYSDEVPYAYPDMSKGAPFDLERVEILKGPQGTLYGQNATGGAVNYIANKPTSSFGAGIEATYASFNAVNLNGYLSGPLTDTLQARLAFDVDEGGAWQRSYTRDDSLGNKDRKFARLSLAWTPTSRLKVAANFNAWADNSQTQAGQLQAVFLAHPADAAFVPSQTNAPVAPDNARAADWLAGTHPANNEHYYQGTLRADYAVSDALTLTYLGTYEHYRQDDLSEPDGIDNELSLLQAGTVSSVSQEFRASGKLLDNKLVWLVGGDYTRNITDETQYEDVAGTTSAYSLYALNHLPFSSFINRSTDDSISEAGFAHVEYSPVTSVTLTGGVRYTQTNIAHGGCSYDDGDGLFAAALQAYEAAKLHGVGVIPIAPGACASLDTIDASNLYHPAYTSQTLDQNNVSWNAGVNWTPIRHTLIYATVSKGYKAGSFPTLTATFTSALKPVTQESVLAYEVGVKSRFWDGRAEVDGDVFYYDYRNKQLAMRELEGAFGLLNTLINVPRSAETGAELAIKVQPLTGLDLSVHGTYIDSDVTGDYLGYNPFSTVAVNLKGESFPNVPKWSLGADAQYSWDINDAYSAFVGIDARYQSQSQGQFGSYQALAAGYTTPAASNPSTPAVQPGSLATINDAYGVIDLRAGVVSRDHHWKIQVFTNNVTNTYYWTQARLVGDAVVRFAGMPTTFGVTVGYKY